MIQDPAPNQRPIIINSKLKKLIQIKHLIQLNNNNQEVTRILNHYKNTK